MANDTDILGNPTTESERALLAAYEQVQALLQHEGLVPAVESNVKEAIACLWQAVNDLALTDDRPDV